MKKIILVVLTVLMVSTPCFAQEVEPGGLFSVEGTRWDSLPFFLMIFPFPWFFYSEFECNIGFHGGEVYSSGLRNGEAYPPSNPNANSFFVDLGIASIVKYQTSPRTSPALPTYTEIGFGIIQPIGIGMMTIYQIDNSFRFPSLTIGIVLLNKTDDNWTPDSE